MIPEVVVFAEVLTIVAVFASTMVALFFAARFLWNRTQSKPAPAKIPERIVTPR